MMGPFGVLERRCVGRGATCPSVPDEFAPATRRRHRAAISIRRPTDHRRAPADGPPQRGSAPGVRPDGGAPRGWIRRPPLRHVRTGARIPWRSPRSFRLAVRGLVRSTPGVLLREVRHERRRCGGVAAERMTVRAAVTAVATAWTGGALAPSVGCGYAPATRHGSRGRFGRIRGQSMIVVVGDTHD
jgi:hypothetical protein